jgi:hypothetical protein
LEKKKDKKANSIINALKCLNRFSDAEIEQFEFHLKHPELKSKFLEKFKFPIKKGMLIKKIILTKINFDLEIIHNSIDFDSVLLIEKQIDLEVRKENLIKIVNKKKILIQQSWLKDIILSESISDLNKIIGNLPMIIRIQLGNLNYSKSDKKKSSIIPIYTPMGNKR